MEVTEVTERGFLIAMGYTGRKGNSKKLLEKASILEAVGSVGSSSMWNTGIRLCDCIPGKITAWSWLCRRPGARGGEPRERWPRDDLWWGFSMCNFPDFVARNWELLHLTRDMFGVETGKHAGLWIQKGRTLCVGRCSAHESCCC